MTSVCGSLWPLVLSLLLWSLPPIVASVVSLGMAIGVYGLRVCGYGSSVNNLPSGCSLVFPLG